MTNNRFVQFMGEPGPLKNLFFTRFDRECHKYIFGPDVYATIYNIRHCCYLRNARSTSSWMSRIAITPGLFLFGKETNRWQFFDVSWIHTFLYSVKIARFATKWRKWIISLTQIHRLKSANWSTKIQLQDILIWYPSTALLNSRFNSSVRR